MRDGARRTRLGRRLAACATTIAPGTTLEAFGPGGGGEVYASYDQVVQSIYWHAWTPPEDAASDKAVTKASVTIASDGSVLSARIINPSEDSSVDRSVQRTLDRVNFHRTLSRRREGQTANIHNQFQPQSQTIIRMKQTHINSSNSLVSWPALWPSPA